MSSQTLTISMNSCKTVIILSFGPGTWNTADWGMGVNYENCLTTVESLRSLCVQKQDCATRISNAFSVTANEIKEFFADYNSFDLICSILHIQ